MRLNKRYHLFFDFESFYDPASGYSLSKMAPPNYILDPKWETIGLAAQVDDEEGFFVDGPEVGKFLSEFDPDKTTTVAFNALFDNCVAAWRYGFVPEQMYCTMRMAVALEGHALTHGHSLRAVGEHFKLKSKKGDTIVQAAGLHRADLIASAGLWRAYQAYAINDNDMNIDLFLEMMPRMPPSERKLMDRVMRCGVVPKFRVDTSMLKDHLAELAVAKHLALCNVGNLDPVTSSHEDTEAVAKTIRSGPKFTKLLQEHGVDVEYKESLTNPGKMIPAFAKTDDFMAGLQEHDDPDVRTLAAVRLGLRSTIEQTRGDRIQSIAKLDWKFRELGNLPIPLKFAAAHTHRLGGDWSMNMQNLPSGRGTQVSKLRKGLIAPDGYGVVVADKSQIECRINGWLCGQRDLLDIFRAKGDPYSVLASAIFGFAVDKNVHKTERFIGKGGVLGLGFGCGAEKFYNMVIRLGRVLGMNIRELLKIWTPELAEKSVRIYRRMNGNIVATWRVLDNILKTAWLGISDPIQFGPCVIGHGFVEGPSGLRMMYANPRMNSDGDLLYDYAGNTYKMYVSKFIENIVQFLARIDTMHDALRIDARGFTFALQSHDELAWIVPLERVAECKAVALEEMRRAPSWAPDLPLDAECNSGHSYGDAK